MLQQHTPHHQFQHMIACFFAKLHALAAFKFKAAPAGQQPWVATRLVVQTKA
jgi:hypothetical protein